MFAAPASPLSPPLLRSQPSRHSYSLVYLLSLRSRPSVPLVQLDCFIHNVESILITVQLFSVAGCDIEVAIVCTARKPSVRMRSRRKLELDWLKRRVRNALRFDGEF